MSKIRIFSYLPNPRVWKSIITARLGGVDIEVIGDKPNNMPNWLWDFDAKPISDEEKADLKSFERKSKRGFKGSLFKTDSFIEQHPFGTVPAGFVVKIIWEFSNRIVSYVQLPERVRISHCMEGMIRV